jgi:effector-binding domain-containing protein/ribosome-associated toxin RatA of RatAB toxin-antitoxin module
MKALKVLGVIILVLIAIFLIIPLFLAENVTISSEKVINAKPATVFQQVNTLKNWKNWSPFESDSTMIDTYEGPEAGLDAKRSWTGEMAGEGSLTIIKSEPYELIQNKLAFGPGGSGGIGTWKFKETDEGVLVNWSIQITDLKYPVERWYGLMSVSMMRPMMEQGLSTLKEVAEAKPAVDIKVVDLDLLPSLSILDSTTIDGIGELLGRNYGMIMAYVMQKEIPMTGFPFAVYYNWDPEGMIVIRAGIPVPEGTNGKEAIEYFELPAGKAVYAKHFGSYDSGETHFAIENYVMANDIDCNMNFIWEVYITDPMNEPDTTKWQTDIYYPFK